MKILLYTDLTIRPDQLFWHRDLGLLTKAFRDLGHNAYLVAHPATEPIATPAVPNELDQPREQHCEAHQGLPRLSVAGPHSPLPTFAPSHIPTSAAYNINHPTSKILDEPVLWASTSQVRDKEWWKVHHPDLVILGLWTRPKYDPIRRAALSATPHVIERADSDGMRTASCGLLTYAKRRFDYFRDRTFRWPSPLSILASTFYSFASILATPWIEYRLRKTLRLLPSILVETPPATLLWKSLAGRLEVDPSKIHCVPHPIQADIFKFDPAIQKNNQIISVGRWESYQKNLPLLLKTLRDFLDKNPSWTSLVIGSGLPPKSPHPRITFLSSTAPNQLARHMQESKIFLFSSRYESFLMSGVEALSCGCAVVGPSDISVLGNSTISVKDSFWRSPLNLLTQKLQIASVSEKPATSLIENTRFSSPTTVAQRILLLIP